MVELKPPEFTPDFKHGFGMEKISFDRWRAYELKDDGSLNMMSKVGESKARALARLLEAITQHYVFVPRSRGENL